MVRHLTLWHTLQWVAVVLASSPPSASRSMARKFSSLVIFGDSYTDQGVHQYRPASDGTVGVPKTVTSTGGRVWAQYVQQYTNVSLYDYAVSGAVCSSTFSSSKRSGIKEDQIPAFLTDNAFVSNVTLKPALSNPPEETVYAIWIGTNDLGSAVFFTEKQPKTLTIMDYVSCVYDQLDRLYAIGARKFVLMNIAPLDLTPQYALPENGGLINAQYWKDKSSYNANLTQNSEKMREYVALVNAVYDAQTPKYVKISNRYPKSSFAVFDIHSLMSDMWHQPSLYFNGTAPLNVTGSIYGCAISNCAASGSRDSFMWYDDLHPSEQSDRIVAREFVNVVRGTSNWTTYWSD